VFRQTDFDDFDHVLVMDRSNLANVLSLARNDEDKKKVKLLLGSTTVPDPYYDDNQFDAVFKLIEQGCKDFIKAVV
jgi:protein-tyrosine phosphatase